MVAKLLKDSNNQETFTNIFPRLKKKAKVKYQKTNFRKENSQSQILQHKFSGIYELYAESLTGFNNSYQQNPITRKEHRTQKFRGEKEITDLRSSNYEAMR